MRFKEFLAEAGKVHTIRKPDIKPRGEPEEPARAFDVRDKDRSALAKLAKDEVDFSLDKGHHTEWFSPESEVWTPGGQYIEVAVKNAAGQTFMVTLPLKKSNTIELGKKSEIDVRGRNAAGNKSASRLEKQIINFVLDALSKKGHGVDTTLDAKGHFDDGPLKGA